MKINHLSILSVGVFFVSAHFLPIFGEKECLFRFKQVETGSYIHPTYILKQSRPNRFISIKSIPILGVNLNYEIMRILKSLARLWIVLSFVCAVSSCDNAKNSSTDLITIDVERAYNEPMRNLMISEVIEDIEYIKLETTPNCLISKVSGVSISENHLAIFDYRSSSFLLFSRSGKFIRKIGSQGPGPEEYNKPIGNQLKIINNEKYLLFWDYQSTIYLYHIDGSFHKKTKVSGLSIRDIKYSKDGKIIVYRQRSSLPKDGGNQLLAYDLDLNLIDSTFFASQSIPEVSGYSKFEDLFTTYQEDIVLLRQLNDSIFKIDKEYQTSPLLVLRLGSLKCPTIQIADTDINKYLLIQYISFSNEHIFISFEGKPRISPSKSGWSPTKYLVNNIKTGKSFFLDANHPAELGSNTGAIPINDLDGVEDGFKFYLIKDGKTWDSFDIIEAKSFLEKDVIEENNYQSSEYFKKFRKLVNDSDIEDNPIIRICYLK